MLGQYKLYLPKKKQLNSIGTNQILNENLHLDQTSKECYQFRFLMWILWKLKKKIRKKKLKKAEKIQQLLMFFQLFFLDIFVVSEPRLRQIKNSKIEILVNELI